MAGIVCRTASRIISSQASCSSSVVAVRHSHWFTSMLSLKTSVPLRAEPKKKKKVDPRREIMIKERLKKKLKKLERVPPELIPIEDFITSAKSFDETRIREAPELSFEESERRALLLKEWSRFKRSQHLTEMHEMQEALEAQRQALEELKLESEELYKAAVSPDTDIFPFQHDGPSYTPPITNYEAPEGKYNDITRVYTQ
ncbi:39S ribosomal protein L40, mitochondrial isoform X1 [Pimephales promelas]|uniref:39S ribosomal protein L40, mitochondrial isoform X1 n=1 Tax=Pimephales promelas TaxID=90988 RepID=UPI0019554AE0|nr:39S ribosomal protein L40, mitochondrial isoform X1 [Pimephales promelas]KAG1968760.1 39S ribosomal protein L40, mitochondrial [Pimephales promelas]